MVHTLRTTVKDNFQKSTPKWLLVLQNKLQVIAISTLVSKVTNSQLGIFVQPLYISHLFWAWKKPSPYAFYLWTSSRQWLRVCVKHFQSSRATHWGTAPCMDLTCSPSAFTDIKLKYSWSLILWYSRAKEGTADTATLLQLLHEIVGCFSVLKNLHLDRQIIITKFYKCSMRCGKLLFLLSFGPFFLIINLFILVL